LTATFLTVAIAADTLLDRVATGAILHGDKGYDSDAIRRKIESKGAAPNIPPKANRRWKNCFSPYLYRNRNAIERMFGRSRICAGSPHDTTASRQTSSLRYASRLPWRIGYEPGP